MLAHTSTPSHGRMTHAHVSPTITNSCPFCPRSFSVIPAKEHNHKFLTLLRMRLVSARNPFHGRGTRKASRGKNIHLTRGKSTTNMHTSLFSDSQSVDATCFFSIFHHVKSPPLQQNVRGVDCTAYCNDECIQEARVRNNGGLSNVNVDAFIANTGSMQI